MLEIFNSLEPFFNNCYRRINIREYARLMKISPPSASKALDVFEKSGLLVKEKERNYIFYVANIKNKLFIDLSMAYWAMLLEKYGLIKEAENVLVSPVIILFGSLSKAEAMRDSDVDIAIFTASAKELHLAEIERKIKRKIQLFMFKDRDGVKNKELLNNILNGHILAGNW